MRLAGIEKGGYYPYPPHMVEATASWFIPLPAGTGGRLLDPCAGKVKIAFPMSDKTNACLLRQALVLPYLDQRGNKSKIAQLSLSDSTLTTVY